MMKKTYIIPAIEVIEFTAENLIATSIETGKGDIDAGDALTNKRQPVNTTWGSQNWDKKEE